MGVYVLIHSECLWFGK